MSGFVAIPLVATAAATAAASSFHRWMRPRTAGALLAIGLASSAIAALPTFWLLALSGVAHLGVENPVSNWSRHLLPGFGPLGALIGLTAAVWAVMATARVNRILRAHRRAADHGGGGVLLVESDEVFAYTLPGAAGTIAVSTGLDEMLTDPERRVVLAHERSHARHRHDRLLVVARVATALVPPLRAAADRLELALERWADEDALAAASGDRQLVARTIARVALAATPSARALGITGYGAHARAIMLLQPRPRAPIRSAASASALACIALAVLQAVNQLHHVAVFGASLVG